MATFRFRLRWLNFNLPFCYLCPMRESLSIQVEDPERFRRQLTSMGRSFDHFVLLDSHRDASVYRDNSHDRYDFLAALDSVDQIQGGDHDGFDRLAPFAESKADWLFGYFSYDLKNESERLSSSHPDYIGFPALHFFQPRYVIVSEEGSVRLEYLPATTSRKEAHELIQTLLSLQVHRQEDKRLSLLESRMSREEYLQTIGQLKEHIQRGDVYEVTYCQEYYGWGSMDPFQIYMDLSAHSPAPFSCLYKLGPHYLLSSSPERFLSKSGSKVISQPIKGTVGRGRTREADRLLRDQLRHDPKEQAENVMIVDLVRNDLSRTARSGSVEVPELFGIYTFPQVHQMISTVSAEIDPKHYLRCIRNAFPMGSMTGAPKVRAMELIEQYEKTRRGLFSGAVGYFSPDKDFDFNVVIRSILFNSDQNYVSFQVGGAITSLSQPEKEYQECQVKAGAMRRILTGHG